MDYNLLLKHLPFQEPSGDHLGVGIPVDDVLLGLELLAVVPGEAGQVRVVVVQAVDGVVCVQDDLRYVQ